MNANRSWWDRLTGTFYARAEGNGAIYRAHKDECGHLTIDRYSAEVVSTDEFQRRAGHLESDYYGGSTAAAMVDRAMRATASWNPCSISAGSFASTTLTVKGAVLGNIATAGFSQTLPRGCTISASVTAADTVRVTIANQSGSSASIGSGTLRVAVTR
jgi:hypothetical protein